MGYQLEIRGWAEQNGTPIPEHELKHILKENFDAVSKMGGEFFLRMDNCMARDHFGIMPGDCPAGTVVCNGESKGTVDPSPAPLNLEDAIRIAVQLRRGKGIVAFSGGVDSALIACLSGDDCVAVGMEGSHDLRHAREVAAKLDLALECVTILPEEIENALIAVIPAIPRITPVDVSIAATLYFVARWAGEHGYKQILAGQGADELFGGYARYLDSPSLEEDLKEDFKGLALQATRDQAVAALHGTYFSMPYQDVRVVRAAGGIPAEEKVHNGIRKIPLRRVAERHMPEEIAYYEKKAMQYGSGIWKECQRLARQNGYKKSVQGYLTDIGRTE